MTEPKEGPGFRPPEPSSIPDYPDEVLKGHRIGECATCGETFLYGWVGDETSNFSPCPHCGSMEWEKWGVEMPDGERVHKSEYGAAASGKQEEQ